MSILVPETSSSDLEASLDNSVLSADGVSADGYEADFELELSQAGGGATPLRTEAVHTPIKSILRKTVFQTPNTTEKKRVTIRKSISLLDLTAACSPAFLGRGYIGKEERHDTAFLLEKTPKSGGVSINDTQEDSSDVDVIEATPPTPVKIRVTEDGDDTKPVPRNYSIARVNHYFSMLSCVSPLKRSNSVVSLNR